MKTIAKLSPRLTCHSSLVTSEFLPLAPWWKEPRRVNQFERGLVWGIALGCAITVATACFIIRFS